jgi:hypothetical protein
VRVTSLQKVALALPFAVFLAIYGSSVGKGFVADDFGWILDSRVGSAHDLGALFFKSSGFYRPVVALTFAADYAMFGTHPLGYGLTNVLFAGICAVLLFLVARELALPDGAATLAVALWLLNPHGINTAVLWMSGRTSLLLTMGSLGAVLLVLRGRPFLALVPAAVALFSKEEAFLLPAILFLWWIGFRRANLPSKRQMALWWLCSVAVIGVYLALRFQTGAMTPWTAPPYYRFTANPLVILKNIREYADRAMTFPTAVALLAWIVLRPSPDRPPMSTSVLICGTAWIVGGYGLTMFLPVRSSLYACYPSAGACLIAADIVARCWTAAAVQARQRAVIVGIVATLGMTPVYVQRNRSTLANARFSSRVLHDLAAATRDIPPGGIVVILDDRTRRPNVETAFNMALEDAFELTSGRRLSFWVEPELQYAKLAGRTRPCPTCAVLRVDVRHQ